MPQAKSRIDPNLDLDNLARLPRRAFVRLWRENFGFSIKVPARREFLARCLAYRIRERTCGGIQPAVRRFLFKIAAEIDAPLKKRSTGHQIEPGTRFLREWGGKIHEATAGDGKFYYAGRTFGSLSEIAREITGTHWSGPLFFGLVKSKPSWKAK